MKPKTDAAVASAKQPGLEGGKINAEELRSWYLERREVYGALAEYARGTIERLLAISGISYVRVTSRTKELDSFLEKVTRRKGYSDPRQQNTDFAGIRVITYLESDVEKACELLKRSFKIHDDKSTDKSDDLSDDRVGYRSVHKICEVGTERERLAECAPFAGLLFEVQVRTVLQHAWAEIEHDRRYKFRGVLPTALRRRLSLVAGVLELADREFDSIAQAVDIYARDVATKTQEGDHALEVDSKSLIAYFYSIDSLRALLFPDLDNNAIPMFSAPAFESFSRAISDLRTLGFRTIDRVDEVVKSGFVNALATAIRNAGEKRVSAYEVAEGLMLFADPEKYFAVLGPQERYLIPVTEELIRVRYGDEMLARLASQGVDTIPF